MKKHRIGLVGTGGIANGHHLPGIMDCPDLELTALCDINTDALKRTAERFGISDSRCFSDYRELIACADVDAVDVTTSNDAHVEIALAAVAAGTEGKTIMYNAGRVHLYENGLLKKISKTLNALGADVIEDSDRLLIQGKTRLRGGTVSSLGDHRIEMMTAIASGLCEDTVAINDAGAVSKSYPDFYDDFEKLGGKIMRIS